MSVRLLNQLVSQSVVSTVVSQSVSQSCNQTDEHNTVAQYNQASSGMTTLVTGTTQRAVSLSVALVVSCTR